MAVATLQGPAAMEQSESSCFQVVLSATGISHRLIGSLDKFSCAGDCSASYPYLSFFLDVPQNPKT